MHEYTDDLFNYIHMHIIHLTTQLRSYVHTLYLSPSISAIALLLPRSKENQGCRL